MNSSGIPIPEIILNVVFQNPLFEKEGLDLCKNR